MSKKKTKKKLGLKKETLKKISSADLGNAAGGTIVLTGACLYEVGGVTRNNCFGGVTRNNCGF